MSLHAGDLCLRLAKIAAVDYTQGAYHQGEIREIMENVKKISLIWKNHGIPFPGKNHGKVMEIWIPEKKICFDLHFNACITI